MADMTRAELINAGMNMLGWEFTVRGPDEWEWEWVQFDADGNITGRQGDAEWSRNLETMRINADQRGLVD